MYTEACTKISCCGLLTTKFLEHTHTHSLSLSVQNANRALMPAAESPGLLGSPALRRSQCLRSLGKAQRERLQLGHLANNGNQLHECGNMINSICYPES